MSASPKVILSASARTALHKLVAEVHLRSPVVVFYVERRIPSEQTNRFAKMVAEGISIKQVTEFAWNVASQEPLLEGFLMAEVVDQVEIESTPSVRVDGLQLAVGSLPFLASERSVTIEPAERGFRFVNEIGDVVLPRS